MGDEDYNSLPVILVSAKDHTAASFIISEIIDNDVTESYEAKEGAAVRDRVWRIVNKYYTADVRLQECCDEQLPAGDQPVDAHVIYLQKDECTVSACSRREAEAAGPRLVLAAARGELRAWCAARRYELVPLAASDDEDEQCGAPRARAALHAHPWRGLVRRDRQRAGWQDSDSESAEEAGGVEEAEEADEAGEAEEAEQRSVERAEWFAAALAALPAAGAAARAEPERAWRLARAEALVAEFCRALGEDFDHC